MVHANEGNTEYYMDAHLKFLNPRTKNLRYISGPNRKSRSEPCEAVKATADAEEEALVS